MLRVSHLSYRYPGNQAATLSDINLTVKNGEIVALVGRNGSGKSTLGRLIAGILELQTGTVIIDEKNYTKHSKGIRANLGIVFQNPENQLLFDSYDEEVGFALPGLDAKELENRIASSLRDVEMSDFRGRELSELSLGQKQRLVIAETLARGSRYLILDEPTTMIDSEGKRKIAELVLRLKRAGHAILYITNLADEILLADRTLILAQGQIAAEIKRPELLTKAELLKQHQIELPTLLQLMIELENQGVDLSSVEPDIKTIAKFLGRKLNA